MNYGSTFIGSVLGGAVGAAVAYGQGSGVQLVLTAIGGVVGAAVGGAIRKARRTSRVQPDPDAPDGQSDGLAKSQRELNDNYWIHHGHLTSTPGLPDAKDSDISH